MGVAWVGASRSDSGAEPRAKEAAASSSDPIPPPKASREAEALEEGQIEEGTSVWQEGVNDTDWEDDDVGDEEPEADFGGEDE